MKIAVFYYSPTGTIYAMASAVAEGASDAGAEVRLRRVAELAPAAAIHANPAWRATMRRSPTRWRSQPWMISGGLMGTLSVLRHGSAPRRHS